MVLVASNNITFLRACVHLKQVRNTNKPKKYFENTFVRFCYCWKTYSEKIFRTIKTLSIL